MVRTFLLSLFFRVCQIVYAMNIHGKSEFLHLVAYSIMQNYSEYPILTFNMLKKLLAFYAKMLVNYR